MDYKEEQDQELDILRSIYPDELEELSDKKFNIHFALDTKPVKYIVLGVEYPEDYPETVPILDVYTSDGSYLADKREPEEDDDEIYFQAELEKDDMKKLLDELNESAQENVGMASVFTLASLLKESAETIYSDKVKSQEKEHEKAILAQEEKEQEKFRGTPVTAETFNEWRKKFRAEFKLDQVDGPKDKNKLTGKQIFEQGLNKDEDEDDIKEGMEELSVK